MSDAGTGPAATSDPEPTCTSAPFSDVPATHGFCGEIDWMVDHSIASGFPNGTFRPTLPVSRQAMAKFLHQFAAII